jgi:hypothetical protein
MSLLPLSDAVYYRTDFVNNRRTQIDDATGTKHLSIDGEGGLDIRYDVGSGNVKNFKISSAGVNWTDNTNNNTTSLERLSLVQQAFQAVELPPNATTLKINDTILVDAGIANQSTTINDGTAILSNASTGGGLNPQLTLTNTNTGNNSVAFEIYKNRTTGASNGDTLFQQSVYGKDSFLNKQEYTRITHTIRDTTGGAEDGSIEMGAFVNGSFNNFLQINGNQNEVNCLKTLDMESNNILTDTKIGTRVAFPTGSYVDFANGTPDDYFRQDVDGIEYKFNDLTNIGTTTLLNKYLTAEQYFKQELITPTNTLTTIIENDLTHHRIKLEETLSGANTEITKDEIVIDDGSGLTAKLTTFNLQFNNRSVLPRRFNQNAFAFSVFGSPTTNIYAVGALADMIGGTTWKVEVSFWTATSNVRNALTYLVYDTTNTDRAQNGVFAYASSGIQTALQFDPAGTPMGTYLSFVDTFQVNPSAVGACNFILSGGTADGSTWAGTCNISIVLTYLP